MTTGPVRPNADTTSPRPDCEEPTGVMAVPFEGCIAFESYRKAQWLHLLRLFRRGLVLWAIFVLVFVANLFLNPPEEAATVIVPILVLVAVVLGLWAFSETGIRRSWRSHKALQEPLRGALFDDHFEVHSRVGSSNLPWSYFHDWRVSEQLLLLYQSGSCLHILSRDLFGSDEDWQRARDLVAQRIEPRRRRKARGSSGTRTRPDDQS